MIVNVELVAAVLAVWAAVAAAAGAEWDPVVQRAEGGGGRFQYVRDGGGRARLADSWLRLSDVRRAARYLPDAHNQYHLFTRQNPSVSQPLVYGQPALVSASNFDARRRTAVIIHGWTNNAYSEINVQLVPAFLAAEDLNVLVVDWGVGAADINYFVALGNSITSGVSVARFISWLNGVSGASLAQYHVAGHSLGGHQAGVVGRHLGRQVAYLTSLDPAMPGWLTHPDRFAPDDGLYTEVIHTNNYVYGFPTPLGQVDFYPNGGSNMPGCNNNNGCDHERVFLYFAESLIRGGFTGRQCATFNDATSGNCHGSTLQMGGVLSKTGAAGLYHLVTNSGSPFSQG